MKTKNGLTYAQIALIAVFTELALIAIQFIYFKIYVSNNPETGMGFTTDYMKYRGFYIFQIIGFFIYTFLVYMIVEKHSNKIFNRILTLLVAGAIVEISFYILISGNYEGAFLYSVLDKIIAATFGVILNSYTSKNSKKYGAYF